MKSFLNSCNNSSPAHAELRAMLFAAGACVLFIGFLAAVHRAIPDDRTVIKTHTFPPPPPVLAVPDAPRPPRPPDVNARFRIVPPSFREINFLTRSYGTYDFSNGKSRDLVLIDGRFREFRNSEQHWFDLDNVYYTDLTGDGKPEAIVLMTHLECGKHCDGGKTLVYVYSQNYPLQEIMKYESGSGMDGCSLKSISVKNRQLTMDLFGKCPQEPTASRDFVIGATYDVTRTEYFFNGKQLVPKKSSLLTLPNHYEVTDGVEVRIVDNSIPDSHEL